MTAGGQDPFADLEGRIRDHAGARDLHAAATLALQSYGEEVLGFLVAALGDEEAASEAFSQVGEDLWRGMPSFRFECSMRTWMYVLARHAASRQRRAAHRWRERPAYAGELEAVVDGVRTRTMPWLRTEVKDRFAELRESLRPDDRTLLVLRVDRGLAWEDVARVFAEQPDPDPEELARTSARLRKRFQAVKAELQERARQSGLLG